ncbi:phosphatidylinositol-specific phospholipase C, X domain protein (macronuclear) [Tetrahymena thermophila SB210]|uniref:Phosphoinositide phospholipase C n=2 Tax=Tetrahymena TaxID=5890 RepID=Q236T7_TETTS|nr:phosphatidylinositol-specific phospholipase C, X domain protein [Tetrahymena thermophila SB210]EAR92413.2 phosphatidylinositol-specific phospholipase C, X domain protein [Tetrahymena thermophila SB210]|eukprot:XP_001012658.2 phosphatidylinositol-specific phospholipase C, X domain protein [Tetrahymena thermophila SB210]
MEDNQKVQQKQAEQASNNQRPSLNQAARKQQSFRQSLIGKDGRATTGKGNLDSIIVNEAVNALVYGDVINRYTKSGKKKHECFFYLLETDCNILQWLSAHKKFSESRIKLSEIKNIQSKPSLTEINNYDSSVSLCLTMDGGFELILEFNDKKTRDKWWKGLLFVKEYGPDYDIQNYQTKEQFIAQLLLGAEIDKKKKITDKEVKKLLRKLLIQINNEELEDKIKKYYKNNEKSLTYNEFIELTITLLEKPEIQPIYQSYCTNNNMILQKDILKFYQNEQGENYDEKQVLSKMNKLTKGREKKMINYLSFCQLIFTGDNSIFDPAKQVISNMDKPLSDYFINSSFRSYLVYDLVTQTKDLTKAYIYLLQKGVRHLDIYCQDGESGVPEALQGVFQVTPVSVEDIFKAIKQYGFERSVYPIIINLEHECSVNQQNLIAQFLVNVFQDMLYRLPEDFISLDYLPSPNQLKKKIIIRAKGKLANIISLYEKKVYKKVKEREEREQYEREMKLKEEEQRKKRQKKEEEERMRKQQQEEEEENEEEDDDEYEYDDSYSGKKSNQKSKNNSNKKNNSNQKKPIVQQKTIQKKPQNGPNITRDNSKQPSIALLGQLNKKQPNEIEQLIDLELNLDKEFLNEDNYATIKTNQINQFQILQNKALITANREIKSMVIQQQNSQYSLVENPKEAMQRKMRTDQIQFQEARSPSLKSQQSNKQRRHTARSSSFKQIPHLEIPFKSDVPLYEYHGSQPNVNLVANKDENFAMDSPVFIKHQNVNEKKRHSLLYMARKRASFENLPIGSILNNAQTQQNESQKDLLQNNSFYGDKKLLNGEQDNDDDDESSDFVSQNRDITSQILIFDNNKSTNKQGVDDINAILSNAINNGGNNGGDNVSIRGDMMQNSTYSPDFKIVNMKSQKNIKKKNSVPISNNIEQCTALFACKYSIQQELSIWSFSQLSEQKISQITVALIMNPQEEMNQQIVNHTRQYLLRTYPKQAKSDHSNYNFLQTMVSGCQFSAMNYYTQDLYLLAYLQYFKQNASCGYVLKPPWLLSSTAKTSNQYFEKEASKPKIWLKVEIISAQSLRIPGDEEKIFSPYISIRLIGTALDIQANENLFVSNQVKNNSCYNPQFENCIADFTVYIPELAFVIFQVYDNPECQDRFAQYAIPVSCIRKGFRTIPLLDSQLNPIPNSFLFAHISIEILTQQQQQQNQQTLKTQNNQINTSTQGLSKKSKNAQNNQPSLHNITSI